MGWHPDGLGVYSLEASALSESSHALGPARATMRHLVSILWRKSIAFFFPEMLCIGVYKKSFFLYNFAVLKIPVITNL